MFMPPPQHLLSPKERLLLTRTFSTSTSTSGRGGPFPTGNLFLFLLLLLLHLVSLSGPSFSQHSPGPGSSWGSGSGVKSNSHPSSTNLKEVKVNLNFTHWVIPEEEICPSAQPWVVSPGSFCTTLWASPYLSNRTELEARERRAVQLYCELDAILERFDCGQEYSVNVKRGQCQLCRQAYREWSCAVVADTTSSGSLDCDSKLMPCPSCASICHQVMRLCPYLSPDRMQYDLGGKSLPQVSQYGGHPAFYCPLENDDPSDPAYTSLCTKPFEDLDHVHNICTNPPKTLLSSTSATFSSHSRRYSGLSRRSRSRSSRSEVNHDYDGPYTSPSSSSYYGGGGGMEDDDENSVTGWSSEFPLHYTTCCWTYASSLVIFDPTKDYPNYGSDAFFSTTLKYDDGPPFGPRTREKHLEEKVLEKLFPGNSSSISNPSKFKNVSQIPTRKTGTKISSSTAPPPGGRSKSKNASTTTTTARPLTSSEATSPIDPLLPGDEVNRVILNCCNSQGDCNAANGDEEGDLEKVGESGSEPSDWNPIQEIKSETTKFIKNRKRSSERLGRSEVDDQGHDLGQDQDEDDSDPTEEEDDEGKLDGSGSALDSGKDSSSSLSTSGSSSSSATVLSLPSLFFKTIDLPVANPTHISELEDLEYDEHYLDTEPELESSSSSAGSEEEESEEDEVVKVKEKVQEKVNASTPSSRGSGSASSSITASDTATSAVGESRGESVHYPKQPDAFMSIVIEGESDSEGGVDHVTHHTHNTRVSHHHSGESTDDPDRTKGGNVHHLEETEDESFTFVENTFLNFDLPGESQPGKEKKVNQGKEQRDNYYYARQHVPTSSSSASSSSFGLSLHHRLLSPTYLISCVFILRRMWCLNSFVMVTGLLCLLLTTFTQGENSTWSLVVVVVSSSRILFWICGSFLHKTNFRERIRTRRSGDEGRGYNRYKKSCVQSFKYDGEKVTDDDKKEWNLFVPITLHLPYNPEWSGFGKLFKGRLLKLRNTSKLMSTSKLRVILKWSGDGYNIYCYNYNNDTSSRRRTHVYNSSICNNNNSAWVQSSRVGGGERSANFSCICKIINPLLLLIAITTTQIQQEDFYRRTDTYNHTGCVKDLTSGSMSRSRSIFRLTLTFTSTGLKCRYKSKRKKKVDDNNCSSRLTRLHFSFCRRKRRRKSEILFRPPNTRSRVKLSCRTFKERIFRDFLLEDFKKFLHPWPTWWWWWLQNLLIVKKVYGVVVFNFKQFLRFIFIANYCADAANADAKLDAPSKSLKSLNNLNLKNYYNLNLFHASMLALLLDADRIPNYKYKLKLLKNLLLILNIMSLPVEKVRLSSKNSYYSSTIIRESRRWKRKRKIVRETTLIYFNYSSSPSSTKNEATTPPSEEICKILQNFLVNPGSFKSFKSGHNSSSQCCRTDKLLRILVKIEIKLKIVPPQLDSPQGTSITIIMIKRLFHQVMISTELSNSYNNKFLVQFTFPEVKDKIKRKSLPSKGLCCCHLCCQKMNFLNFPPGFESFYKIKFCPILKCFSRKRRKEFELKFLRRTFSVIFPVASDLHLLSLLLSLAKRAARQRENLVVGEKQLNLNLKQLQLVSLLHLILLRGQSKTLIGLWNKKRPTEKENRKSFKVYARGTLNLLVLYKVKGQECQSTIKKNTDKSRKSCTRHFGKKSDWCSSKKSQTAAGFEIHPLIKL